MVNSILPTPEFTGLTAQPPLPDIVRTPLDVFSEQCSTGDGSTMYENNSTVLVNFAANSEELSQSDYDATYNAFMTAYNELGAENCFQITDMAADTQMEEMYDDDDDDDDQRRHRKMSSSEEPLVFNNSSSNSSSRHLLNIQFDFTTFFTLNFRCIGCPSGSSLFVVDGGRRSLGEELLLPEQQQDDEFKSLFEPDHDDDIIFASSHSKLFDDNKRIKGKGIRRRNLSSSKKSGSSSNSEDNSDDDDHQGKKSPMRVNFQERFAEILQENPTPGIDHVSDVRELKRYPCDEKIDNVDTAVVLKLSGDYNFLLQNTSRKQRKEISAMEKAVRKAYNSINTANAETCDVEFRRVIAAKYVSAERISNGKFTMLFNLSYDCRNCASSPTRTLFDEVTDPSDPGRQNFDIDEREMGPKEPPCVCAIGATLYRGPTTYEFSKALAKMISFRRLILKLTFVESIDPDQSDSVYETEPVVTNPPTPSPTYDDPLYGIIKEYPLSLQEATFGSENVDSDKFPMYPILSNYRKWPFLGWKKISAPGTENDKAYIRIGKVLTSWGKLQEGYNLGVDLQSFIEDNEYKAIMVRGIIVDSVGFWRLFLGIIARYKTSDGAYIDKLIPLVKPFFNEWKSNEVVYGSTSDNDDADDSCLDNFVSQAFENVMDTCNRNIQDSSSIVHVQRKCLKKIDSSDVSESSSDSGDINDDYNVESIPQKRYFGITQAVAYGYADCVRKDQNDFDNIQLCTSNIFESAVKEYLKNYHGRRRRAQSSSSSCEKLIASAQECLSCQTCSTEDKHVDCCQNSDCPNENDICANQSCFPDGNPRFTLTWHGDDDLDLHVVSPKGIDISSKNKRENENNRESGGQWRGRGQSIQGKSTMVESYAEHIYFPMDSTCEDGKGVYQYFVKQSSKTGIRDDSWALSVYQNNMETNFHTGSGPSPVFDYVC